VEIERLPAEDAWYDAWHQLFCAVRVADQPDLPCPSRQATYVGLTQGWPAETSEHWIARDGDVLLGASEITLPTRDNLDNAWLELAVHPEHRRRGVGTALFEHAEAYVRGVGRKRLMVDVVETRPGGAERSPGPAAFAARHGAKRALEEVRRRLVLTEAAAGQRARLDAALEDAWRHAAGYSIVQWDEGGTPDDVVADIAALDSDFLTQAPLGDMEWEPELVDVARTREIEKAIRDRGWRRCHTAARHDATGEVIAWTTLGFFGDTEDHAWQLITVVRPDHRGHRLGAVVKLENLRYAQRRLPALRTVDTCNATVNDHMVAINDLMGFQPVDLMVGWQLHL